jgi:hypothetical protein
VSAEVGPETQYRMRSLNHGEKLRRCLPLTTPALDVGEREPKSIEFSKDEEYRHYVP